MERPNLQKISARLKGTRKVSTGGQKQSGASDPHYRNRRLWSLTIVLAVLACMVLTVMGNAGRKAASSLMATEPGPQSLAQPTSGTAAMREFNLNMTGDGSVASPAQGPQNAPATGGSNQPANPNWDRMIIRTATLQLQVKDVAPSLDEVRGLAGAHGGYVVQSDSRIEGEYTIATITLQVPVREFDSVVSKLRKVGIKVLGENVSSSDVTEEYTDLQSQLRNLQATEQRMIALMQKAEKIEDILTLDRRDAADSGRDRARAGTHQLPG